MILKKQKTKQVFRVLIGFLPLKVLHKSSDPLKYNQESGCGILCVM